MKRRNLLRWIVFGPLALILAGCGNQDADRLTRVCRKTVAKIDQASGGSHGRMTGGYQAFRGALSEHTLDSRVHVRLIWEKTLEDAEIAVSLDSPGVVRLQGRVAEFPQRMRAQDVAMSTSGVKQVINEVIVAQKTTPDPEK